MSEHTKEPWRVGRPGTVVADEPVPDMGGSDDVGYYGGHMVAESVTGANARRIVACVNACEGVPTELLEAYPAPFSELRAERDRLLVAMKKLVGRADDPNIGWRGHSENKDEFTCEYCRAASLDSTKIQHGPDCPVPQVLSAIAEVKGEPA